MKHDYEGALEMLKNPTFKIGECLSLHIPCGYNKASENIKTIINALKLAAKLEQEPSEGMILYGTRETQTSFEPIAYNVFKAMLDQARKEIE